LRRRAFGGELIDVRPARGWLTGEDLEKLAAEPFVLSLQRIVDGVRLVVADATTATQQLLDHLRDREVGPVAIDQVSADYDDIFVQLIAAETGASTSEVLA
jgi:hypothetical protein